MASDLLSAIERLLLPVRTRVANMVSRAVITLVDDTQKMQIVQLKMLGDEVRARVERFQNYGFTSVPKADGKAEAAVMFVGGKRDHGLVVAIDDRRFRLTGLSEGEVALYDATGSKVVLKANGDIEVTPHSGTVKVVGDVVAGSISLKNHKHIMDATDSPIAVAGAAGTISGTTGAAS